MQVSRAVVLSDTDLFPPGTVTINGLKVLGGYPVDRVIAYTTSVITASGSGIARVFGELLQGQSSSIKKVENFQHYEGGGMGADLEGNRVLVGNPNFMLRMGIKPPKGISAGDALLTAINQEPVAVFILNYTTSSGTRRALLSLIRHKLIPVLATRDFNITPSLFAAKFKISSTVPEFPPLEDKLKLSDPDRMPSSEPDAVICREGVSVYTECILLGRRLYKISRTGAVFSVLVAVIGVLIMFYLAFTGAYAAASPGNVMAYMVLWTVANLFISCGVSRY
jgi:cation transport ATPase